MFVTFDPICGTFVRHITLVSQFPVVDYATSSVAVLRKSITVMRIAKKAYFFVLDSRCGCLLPGSWSSKYFEWHEAWLLGVYDFSYLPENALVGC